MIVEREGRLFVEAPMTMETAPTLLAQGEQLVAASDRVLDLSGVAAADSSALALVLAWRRSAKAAGKKLTVVGPPASFVSLASLYDVNEFILDTPLPDESGEPAAAL